MLHWSFKPLAFATLYPVNRHITLISFQCKVLESACFLTYLFSLHLHPAKAGWVNAIKDTPLHSQPAQLIGLEANLCQGLRTGAWSDAKSATTNMQGDARKHRNGIWTNAGLIKFMLDKEIWLRWLFSTVPTTGFKRRVSWLRFGQAHLRRKLISFNATLCCVRL